VRISVSIFDVNRILADGTWVRAKERLVAMFYGREGNPVGVGFDAAMKLGRMG